MPHPVYHFGPFHLDVGERRLLRGDENIPLRAKVFDTLRVLVENHNRLIPKDKLMKAVWSDSIVGENNLDQNISALRKVLGQSRGAVNYIETVPRQGYRFIHPVAVSSSPETLMPPQARGSTGPSLVERGEQLRLLRTAMGLAYSGRRQMIFVTGEPGIGKTTLVRAFCNELAGAAATRVALGNCQDRHGEGEAYMPVLEALSRLMREDGGACRDVLTRSAPSWQAQLSPAPGGEAARLGLTTERMLREMAEAIELLTARYMLVLVLEDLHWSDYSTVDLLARIANRMEPARLLVIGTYRPADAQARSHTLQSTVQQLKLREGCQEVKLGYWTEAGVAEYLDSRFGPILPSAVAARVHARTQGNPLFVALVVNSWMARGLLKRTEAGWSLPPDIEQLSCDVPDDLRQMIEQQITEMEEADQEIIEAASVAGSRFCAAEIAPALDRDTLDVEGRCARFASSGRFFAAGGAQEWPDGTICERYHFLHSLHRDVVYERIPAGRKVRLHELIAARLEQGYRGHEGEISAELAMHFREARDAPRSLHYLQRAAEQSLTRSAHREAISHLTAALGMLRRLPELEDRVRRERDVLALLAPALAFTRGYADPEVEQAFHRAYELSTGLGDPGVQFPVVFGLAAMLEIRGQYPKAQQLMERHLPEQERSGGFWIEARDLLACSRFHQGDFRDALDHGEKGARAYSPGRHSVISASFGEDPGIDCYTWMALSRWFLGYPDQAIAEGRRAVSLAQDPSRSYSLANAQTQLATLHQLRQEEEPTLFWAEEALTLATQQGYPYRCAVARILRGWALARTGQCDQGARAIQEGMDACAAVGAELDRPYHMGLLADVHLMAGRPAEAAAVLESALARVPVAPAFFYSAELYRVRGVAEMQRGHDPESARPWLTQAFKVAEFQAALSLELRAALSLADLSRLIGPGDSARELLARTYEQFSEGFETPDLQRAARCLSAVA